MVLHSAPVPPAHGSTLPSTPEPVPQLVIFNSLESTNSDSLSRSETREVFVMPDSHWHSQPDVNPHLIELLKDAEKFVFSHRAIIERASLQTYGSALVFSPTLSKIRNRYWKERLSFIEMTSGVGDRWGAHRQTLEGHGRRVSAVVFSRNGQCLETDRGLLSVTVNSDASSSCGDQKPASGFLFVGDDWVTGNGKSILWLPRDYRATCVAVHSQTLILGHASGQVTFFRFAFTE